MNKRVADLLVETLQAAGVKTCSGMAGATMNRSPTPFDRSQIELLASQILTPAGNEA
jgi:pyruvate dehydrogenase (quinone)